MATNKPLKVLFLDDRSKRFTAAMKQWKDEDLTIVCTAKECIKLISSQTFNLVSLDHDLGFEEFVPSVMPNTGMEVIRHICRNKDFFLDFWVPEIIIHTANKPAGFKMVEMLHEIGFNATYKRFEYDE